MIIMTSISPYSLINMVRELRVVNNTLSVEGAKKVSSTACYSGTL